MNTTELLDQKIEHFKWLLDIIGFKETRRTDITCRFEYLKHRIIFNAYTASEFYDGDWDIDEKELEYTTPYIRYNIKDLEKELESKFDAEIRKGKIKSLDL